ncbi:MAG: hypothetical protein OXF83_11405, partial [Anaerolineaceae bacterium]|nr:hypothetical protein [Anaerolineaceae bacterium]
VARLGPRSHRAVADRYADAYFHSVEYTYAQPYFYTFPYPYLHSHPYAVTHRDVHSHPHADTYLHSHLHPHTDVHSYIDTHTHLYPDCNAIAHRDHRATEQNGEKDRVVPQGRAGSRLHLQQGVSLFLPACLARRQL